jgi:hypothetical protein
MSGQGLVSISMVSNHSEPPPPMIGPCSLPWLVATPARPGGALAGVSAFTGAELQMATISEKHRIFVLCDTRGYYRPQAVPLHHRACLSRLQLRQCTVASVGA